MSVDRLDAAEPVSPKPPVERGVSGWRPAAGLPPGYRELEGQRIVACIDKLGQRIRERFPESGLGQVCETLHNTAQESKQRCEWIKRPHYGIRIAVGLLAALALLGFVFSIDTVQPPTARLGLWQFAQVLESVINDIVLLGAAAAFLVTVEVRVKRARALAALNELRAITHVIDMHQLTKDPVGLGKHTTTAASPSRPLTAHQLNRYLNYSAELLSLTGKVAALYAQHLPDAVVLSTVTELEELTVGLSTKIFQKLLLLQGAHGPATV